MISGSDCSKASIEITQLINAQVPEYFFAGHDEFGCYEHQMNQKMSIDG